MVGVLFVVTIPTEQEEWSVDSEFVEQQPEFGHSSKRETTNYSAFANVRMINCILLL